MNGRPSLPVAPAALSRRRRPARAIALLLPVGCLLIAARAASAGGDFVDLAVGGGRIWFVGPGVRSLDLVTGRSLSMPRLAGAAYPLSVTVTGGAAWIGSVENGYVQGTLSRIDMQTGRVRVVWRRQDSSVQDVAAGAGSVWVLIGSSTSTRIARFTPGGRLRRVWNIPRAARIAADREGCWIATDRWLLRIDSAGRLHRVLRAAFGGVMTGAGAVWLPRATSVLRLDEHTGKLRVLATGRLGLGGFQHDLAAGDGALWALRYRSRTKSLLVRYDMRSGRSTGTVSLPGNAEALVVKPGAIWIATVLAPPAGADAVIRIDPRTLRPTLRISVV